MNPIEIALKKKPGEKYTILESIIMAWNVKHPADAELAADELAALTAEMETVKRERDAAIALLWKMAKEEPCDNDGRGCICVNMAYDFIVYLKAGKA